MTVVIIVALVGLVLVDIVWEHLPRDDDRLDAEMRHRNLMRELHRHDN